MKFSAGIIIALCMAATNSLVVNAGCPMGDKSNARSMSQVNPHTTNNSHQQRQLAGNFGDYGIPEGGFAAVREDIKKFLVTSQDFFPADFADTAGGANYGGLMIRLAWHCSGSFRASDGRGGCDGGRIRFEPELNWDDNANLNNALKLLEPIKEKYGSLLSWGDLIILTGTTAIESMGGPILGFCGGRVDNIDGSDSLVLGPSAEQEELAPCQSIGMQGQCQSPLGPTTIGLIYVNPDGPVTAPGNPVASGVDIRDSFGRMGFNDTESVALIGGGHAFGKNHGACPTPPCGEAPLEGIGPNTYTSGFEGAWTTKPTTWTNQYFSNLLNLDWERAVGPGGHEQWSPNGTDVPIVMLTADIALSADPEYRPISEEFESDISSLENQFAHAWYRLTSQDMGPRERCLNEDLANIPPAQSWQNPLPMEQENAVVDYEAARSKIQELIDEDSNNIAAFSNLAYQCASTFRSTDHRGGCNGARIRFVPENEWEANTGTAEALSTLEVIKESVPTISYADLIVLAGQVAIEAAGDVKLEFCEGRVDAVDGSGSDYLAPRFYTPAVASVRDDIQVKGLTPMEGVSLYARPSSTSSNAGDNFTAAELARSATPNALSNVYFTHLLVGDGDFDEYEVALLEEEFLPIVQQFADDEAKFLEVFTTAWTKMMVADRFDGPVRNVCSVKDTIMPAHDDDDATEGSDNADEPSEDVEEGGSETATSSAFGVIPGVIVGAWVAVVSLVVVV